MTQKQREKLIQYLNEAHATELALVRTLEAHLEVTPDGDYRAALAEHLRETREHAERVEARLGELGAGRSLIEQARTAVRGLAGQGLALSKGPLDLVRGSGVDEKLLKNARDEAASEALEIATYDALEQLATAFGDEATADLAASIRADEERMLDLLRDELPRLADAVAASLAGPAASAEPEAAAPARGAAADRAEGVPGGGPPASPGELPIADYDERTADDVAARLPDLTQAELAAVEQHERAGRARRTILERIDSLRDELPWPGYDEQTAREVASALAHASPGQVERARRFERRHKDRKEVVEATDRQLGRS